MTQRELASPQSTMTANLSIDDRETLRALASALKHLLQREEAFPIFDPTMLLDEYAINPSAGTNFPTSFVTLTPNIDRPVLVTAIIASVPTATTGVLTIGATGQGANKRAVNISPGQAPLNNLAMVIFPSDVFTLTVTGTGPSLISIEVMGNYLRRTDWRVI